MTIAITGATGQFGSHAVRTASRTVDPAEIVAVVRDRGKAQPLADLGVTVRVADYGDPEALRAAFDGIDKLLFVSGSEIGKRGPQHTNVVEAAKAAHIGLIAYTSVLNLDGAGASNPVAPDHILTERLIAESGISYILLRNGWYSENYEQTARTAAATGQLITGAPEGRVSSAARDDYAEAAVAALLDDQHDNHVYELAGDTTWTPEEFAAIVTEITGKPVAVSVREGDALVDALVQQGAPRGAAQFQAGVDAAVAEGALDGGEHHELSGLIGRPTTPLRATLQAALGA